MLRPRSTNLLNDGVSYGLAGQKKLKDVQQPKTFIASRDKHIPTSYIDHIDVYFNQLEKRHKLPMDFLRTLDVSGSMRVKLMDWLLSVSSKFEVSNETWMLTCLLTDRACVGLKCTRNDYQLLGLSCFYIALKFEEVTVPHISDVAYMGGNHCSPENILEMEKEVLKSLKFQLFFTYPNHYLHKFASFTADNAGRTIYMLARIYTDIAIMSYNTAFWLPSEIAAASFYLSYFVHDLTFDSAFVDKIQLNESALERSASRLAMEILNGKKTFSSIKNRYRKHKEAYEKYQDSLPRLDRLLNGISHKAHNSVL